MQLTGLRALPHPAIVTTRYRFPARPRILYRSFQTSPIWRNIGAGGGAGANNGDKPPGQSAAAEDEDVQPQNGAESTSGRSRVRASSSLKSRIARKHAAPALPPVKLPQDFLDSNVTLHDAWRRPQLPIALAEDAKQPKTSSVFVDPQSAEKNTRVTETNKALEDYFDTTLNALVEKVEDRSKEIIAIQANSCGTDELVHKLTSLTRVYDMLLDSAWHLSDSLYPARHAEYTYTSRPFWWWHYYKDFDRQTQEFRDQFLSVQTGLDSILDYDWRLDHSLSQAIADLPILTFSSIRSALRRELTSPPPPDSESKNLKRQITILSMSGYSGQAISEAVAEHVAYFNDADLVRLNAQDLSVVVGDYLDQDWAYSRGSLSNMGFRAAEMNGKLYRDPDAIRPDEEDNDPETGVINIRAASGSLEDELSKIKQGGYDPFGKWESLKVDKVLDQITQAAELKHGSPREKPLIVHIHDFVELSMTLEGSMLITRIRNLVDAAWQQGSKIAIFGTSSSAQPSDEYENMLRDLSAGDFVISRHIDPHRALRQPKPSGGSQTSENPFPLQETDIFVENVQNINRMLKSLGSQHLLDFSDAHMKIFMHATDTRAQMLKKSVLPLPEVYNIACAAKRLEEEAEGAAPGGVYERLLMGPLRQRPGQRYLDEPEQDGKSEGDESQKKTDDSQAGGRAALKMNEYEKRISSGHINRQNLRTTFADVHVPKDTISALKLLTTLALVRPDAFSYGVLAQDKIPGCLLYGPPGTGKTLLAKAVAKESGANMLEISGATINDKWVGESEKLIRAVFTLAKKISPCVVFIDEADSLLANRSMLGARASHRSHINQFLKEWDGLEETEAFIMVATNRPFDLDDAVLRRLPRRLLVDLPLQPDRTAILKILLRGESLDSAVSLDDLAKRTSYYSGSDLKNACVAAAMAAVEEENEAAARHTGPEPYEYPKKRILRQDHFDKALLQIPASISEDMQSLKQIRKFDEEYGAKKKGTKKTMGFGVGAEKKHADAEEVRIRRGL
ncbi:ATPase family AAA domain-containing protein [Fusarium heterosporum]|uniref:ATPase family AAA domain-containing protein n=1 Tax=Fusarium heterosporum TaxID=42747 RepID=A0A8H5T8F3_FUSHE|nr:ATPase family AAA domain-containing protein [Fusarium heterosporum]